MIPSISFSVKKSKRMLRGSFQYKFALTIKYFIVFKFNVLHWFLLNSSGHSNSLRKFTILEYQSDNNFFSSMWIKTDRSDAEGSCGFSYVGISEVSCGFFSVGNSQGSCGFSCVGVVEGSCGFSWAGISKKKNIPKVLQLDSARSLARPLIFY